MFLAKFGRSYKALACRRTGLESRGSPRSAPPVALSWGSAALGWEGSPSDDPPPTPGSWARACLHCWPPSPAGQPGAGDGLQNPQMKTSSVT